MFKHEPCIIVYSTGMLAIPQHQSERKEVVCQHLVSMSLILYAIGDDRHYRVCDTALYEYMKAGPGRSFVVESVDTLWRESIPVVVASSIPAPSQ